ncbi:hypothetical protein CALCODRAFT_523786 [Calocera cornea HHB12733]|uniref:Uncharacterized protein n=1 Tax=Calocera cornea HHB12733 TaxID=1353952 RepID=A0A165GFV5_9BASI|nr:hypothetical protein CALCODRAFT_523786 [Calocera cornea HHB12733]
MPSPWRIRAQGRDVRSVPLMVWEDDVSGNVSKQWNKHIVMCLSNLALPRMALEEEANIHFVGTSMFAGPVELMEGLVKMLEELNTEGYEAYNAATGKPILFTAWIAILAGDNPLQAELCSQRGMQANKFCRRCRVGGSSALKRTAEGYAKLFEAGCPRTSAHTALHVQQMLLMTRELASQSAINSYATEHGISDAYAENVQKKVQEGVRTLRIYGPDAATRSKAAALDIFLEHGNYVLMETTDLDVHRSAPVEILHTFLLGIVKYLWTALVNYLEARANRTRLASMNERGLNLPKFNAAYMIQHRKQLIGKHFKTLVQTIPFVVIDLIDDRMLEAWVLAGVAGAMLWTYRIDDRVAYEVR